MTSGISKLGGTDDNGFCIASRYVTYAYGDKADRDQLQITISRMLMTYALMNIEGNGSVTVTLLPEILGTKTAPNPYAFTQPAFAVHSPSLDDLNVPLNVSANRAFMVIDSHGPNCAAWLLQRIDIGVTNDPRMMVSGR